MRRILTLLFLLLQLPLFAQYKTTWNRGVTDITSSLATVNAWKALPQGGGCNSINMGSDGMITCMGTDGYPYQSSAATTTWTKVTAMGNQMHTVVTSAGTTFALGPGGLDWAICQTYGSSSYSILQWNGSAWVGLHGCLSTLQIGGDGSLVGFNTLGDTYQSTNHGSTWVQISGHTFGPNFTYVSEASANSVCGIVGGTLYTFDGTHFNSFPTQPGGTPIGCLITGTRVPTLYTWNASNVVRMFTLYDGSQAGTAWVTLAGTAKGLTGPQKGMVLGLTSTGAPQHLNVYAGYISGSITGSWPNGCHGTCPPGVTHTATLQVQLPHGLNGYKGFSQGTPSTNLNAVSFDYTPTCDPFFGDPNDLNCIPTMSGLVLCSALQQGIYFPDPVPTISNSIDAKSTTSVRGVYAVPLLLGAGWGATAICGVTANACATFTSATCNQTTQIELDYAALGPNITEATAIADATALCDSGAAPNSFKLENTYETGNPATCVNTKVVWIPMSFGLIECY
jgi:hypothetical protein